MDNNIIKIKPQAGMQTKALATKADIAIFGGAAGSGKTFTIIMEMLKHTENSGFKAVGFRRTSPQITAPQGLWDEAIKFYSSLGAKFNSKDHKITFQSGATIQFSHMQYEKDKLSWQGSQIALIVFDELTHFTKSQFFYMLSRNRSMCGVRPYLRATCNPDPESFVADMIEWYLDKDGYPDPEKSGKLRYFVVHKDEFVWGNSKDEVLEQCQHLKEESYNPYDLIKSFTFIPGTLDDNKILTEQDPQYRGNLLALSEEDQLRLLRGNWKVKIDRGRMINHEMFRNLVNNKFVKSGQKFITADIAGDGSDLLVIFVWDGKKLIDIGILDRNSGKQAIDMIKGFAEKYAIPNNHILFDADGIGGGVTGFIKNAVEFKGGRRAFKRANYLNLRTQCYYEMSKCINMDQSKSAKDYYYISPEVANKIYPYDKPSMYKGKTIMDVMLHQTKAIKKEKTEFDGKVRMIKKDELKGILGGVSPDFLDAFSMREYFEFINTEEIKPIRKSDLGLF